MVRDPTDARFYNKRGTAEQWIKNKQAMKMTLLSCHRFPLNEVRLWLSLMTYNLGNLWRRLVLPKRIDNSFAFWPLCEIQDRGDFLRQWSRIASTLFRQFTHTPLSQGAPRSSSQ